MSKFSVSKDSSAGKTSYLSPDSIYSSYFNIVASSVATVTTTTTSTLPQTKISEKSESSTFSDSCSSSKSSSSSSLFSSGVSSLSDSTITIKSGEKRMSEKDFKEMLAYIAKPTTHEIRLENMEINYNVALQITKALKSHSDYIPLTLFSLENSILSDKAIKLLINSTSKLQIETMNLLHSLEPLEETEDNTPALIGDSSSYLT